jgi:archaellum component FlaG (FlaF/FlaG flagellin family)
MLVLLCFVVAVLIIAWFVMKDVNTPLADKLSDKLSAHTKKVEEVIAPVVIVDTPSAVSSKVTKASTPKTKKITAKVVDKSKKPRGRRKKTD